MVHFSDGSIADGGYSGTKNYNIYPNNICIVEPDNPRNKARGHWGRICKFTGKSRNIQERLLAHVEFLDKKGGYGYIDLSNLKPHS